MKKVIVQLVGGLGNQFFQYGAARALAKKIDATLLLDVSEFDDYKIRNYELYNFKIEQCFATSEEVSKLKKKRIFNRTYFREKRGKFIKLNPKGSAYLEGYFQSEKYFEGAEFEIRSNFEFRNLDFVKDYKTLNEIKSSNSVSLHVRGGDYISDPEVAKIHNVCDKKYYQKAIKYIKEKIENPRFFVFSNDLEYAKTLIDEGEFVKTQSWSEDLYFMQNCKHNIIPNSSFAYMAAWLNKNENKIVIAPKRWYNKGSHIDYKNVVPKGWIKL